MAGDHRIFLTTAKCHRLDPFVPLVITPPHR
jgi:hypothetical protein